MKRLILILVAGGLVLSAASVHAGDATTTLPALKWPASGRVDYALGPNGSAVSVGKIDFIAGATPQLVRLHEVEQDVAGSSLSESVAVDGRYCVRENAEPRWTVRAYQPGQDFYPAGEPITGMSGENVQAVYVGKVDVASVPTIQYQVTVDPSAFNPRATAAKLDLFLGEPDGYLHKGQLTITGPLRGEAVVDFAFVYRVYDFNAPIVVGPPPADLVDAQAAARSESLFSRALMQRLHNR